MPSINASWIGVPVGLFAGFAAALAAGIAAALAVGFAAGLTAGLAAAPAVGFVAGSPAACAAVIKSAVSATAVRCHFAIVIAPPDW
ncbi:hypothetical protein [Paraburkholderia sp. RL17-381-BIF-C]|jgi:hypothetical protein|uniref:hypothetical protein n=1 Tax=Paraburkholderia sp. RL17-381-BIF-C TaxID=3031635 RepID=UPI0038BB239F